MKIVDRPPRNGGKERESEGKEEREENRGNSV